MAEESKKYTAFISKKGLFQYRFMPFGLKSNPNAFSRFMQNAFTDMVWKEIIMYIDDIIIFSDSVQEHLHRLGKFLQRC